MSIDVFDVNDNCQAMVQRRRCRFHYLLPHRPLHDNSEETREQETAMHENKYY